ncbi:MAG: methyltransferase [Bacteroidales bacterium]|nr:methyltransferase [Bacteroidales bacterium]MBN2698573.1 methyltransferase [Bacteroidales bacterium]
MPNSWFRFKQFTIEQDSCAMKVGTDGVILGAWTNTEGCRTALDIGTGTGLLALMLAQKSSMLNIVAIEIDPRAASQAAANAENSKFKDRITVLHCSLGDLPVSNPAGRYDLIICNPPYFTASMRNISKERTIARHDDALALPELVHSVSRLLFGKGRFYLILPVQSRDILEGLIGLYGLCINRILEIFPTPEKEAVRMCFEISRNHSVRKHEKLIIETGGRHHYSTEYRELTGDFYL